MAIEPLTSKDKSYRESLIRRLWEAQTDDLPDAAKRTMAEAAQELEGSRVETPVAPPPPGHWFRWGRLSSFWQGDAYIPLRAEHVREPEDEEVVCLSKKDWNKILRWLYPVAPPPEKAPAKPEGMTFGCNGCDATVTLAFTDATKTQISIVLLDGWTASARGTFCPKCSAEKTGEES